MSGCGSADRQGREWGADHDDAHEVWSSVRPQSLPGRRFLDLFVAVQEELFELFDDGVQDVGELLG